jgi:hypothetical protein
VQVDEGKMNPSVVYRTKGARWENFGDALTNLLIKLGSEVPVVSAEKYHLHGSVIDDENIARDLADLSESGKVAVWGGGVTSYRDISPDLRNRVKILGVRGPLSRDILRLPHDTPLGDPALLLPFIYEPKVSDIGDVSLCVTHARHEYNPAELKETSGADVVLSAKLLPGRSNVEKLIDRIAGAKFVLAGCLHAAIVACAYRRPFAFFDGGYIDIPLKWRDFAASIEIPHYFVRNLNEAMEKARALPILPKLPSLEPMLSQYPFQLDPAVVGAMAICRSRNESGSLSHADSVCDSDFFEAKRVLEYKNEQLEQYEFRIGRLQRQIESSGALLRREKLRLAELDRRFVESEYKRELLEQSLAAADEFRMEQLEALRSQHAAELNEAQLGSNSLRSAVASLQHQVDLMKSSTSWRVSVPLRTLKSCMLGIVRGGTSWVQFKPGSRPRRVLRRMAVSAALFVLDRPRLVPFARRAIDQFPPLRQRLGQMIVHTTGLGEPSLAPTLSGFAPGTQPTSSDDALLGTFSSRARGIFNELRAVQVNIRRP